MLSAALPAEASDKKIYFTAWDDFRGEANVNVITVGARTSVVTFGTPAALPVAFDHVVRVIGEHDWRNAEMPVDVVVPGAGHHTNRALRGAVPVTATLKHVLGIA